MDRDEGGVGTSRQSPRRRAQLGALAVALAVTACGGRGPSNHGTVRLRIAYTSLADVGALPSLMAQRVLADQGYRVVPTFYGQPELAVEALARGDAEFANGGTRAFWAAVAKGADLILVMEHAEKGFELVAVPGIARCEDLDGRTLALSSRGALPTALAEAYLQGCPGARPHVLVVPHSADRLGALISGAIDATVLQRSDVARLEQRAPGRFHELEQFRRASPRLELEGVFVSGRFARANRQAVVDYLRARLDANRVALRDPARLLEEARRWPAVGTLDERIVAGEVSAPAWSPDGGSTRAGVAATLDFFVRGGSLPASLRADRLADLSFLEEALRPEPAPAGDAAEQDRHW